jgi:hypothetical protein
MPASRKQMKRILNVLIAEALRDKLFTTGSVKRVLNWRITPLFCTIVLLIVRKQMHVGAIYTGTASIHLERV